jgi:hypothetical protein
VSEVQTKDSRCELSDALPPPSPGFLKPPVRLGLLPYKLESVPRTANIIAHPASPVFALKTGAQVLAFLQVRQSKKIEKKWKKNSRL